jgi:hypothetical protein
LPGAAFAVHQTLENKRFLEDRYYDSYAWPLKASFVDVLPGWIKTG